MARSSKRSSECPQSAADRRGTADLTPRPPIPAGEGEKECAFPLARRERGLGGEVCALVGSLVLLLACAGPQRAVVPEGAPRRPDGVAIDPITAYPMTMPDANASDGIVALETPLSPEAARAVVMHFWSAVVSEDRVS